MGEVRKVTVELSAEKSTDNAVDEQQQKEDALDTHQLNEENAPNSPSLSVDTVEPETEKDLDAIDDDEDLDDIDDEDLESEDDDDIVLLNLDAEPQGFY